MLIRPAKPILRPFVETLWASGPAGGTPATFYEHVLPTGLPSLVFRLSDRPIRVVDEAHPAGYLLEPAFIGGARSRFYARAAAAPASSVGAVLLPGAVRLLTGLPADELSQRHVSLADVWPGSIVAMREQLLEARSPAVQLDLFEVFLARRLPRVMAMHPAVAAALAPLDAGVQIHGLVAASGYSHRRFNELFRREVGLTPKSYSRIRRFQRALRLCAPRDASWSWVEVALAAGYSDQSHFHREFRELAGVTPAQYRAAAPAAANHVPVPADFKFVQYARARLP